MFERILLAVLIAAWAAAGFAQELRDPTRPLEYSNQRQAQAPLELNSILIGEGRRIAVINGQRATEEQRIGDVHVLRILPDRVIVRRNGQRIELKLRSSLTVRKNTAS